MVELHKMLTTAFNFQRNARGHDMTLMHDNGVQTVSDFHVDISYNAFELDRKSLNEEDE